MAALKCFVILPFRDEYDAVFDTIRRAAVNAVPGEEIECRWLKDVRAAGRISDDIVDSLRQAALCVADVTGCNPNVMWETGYAMALGKPTILLGQRVNELPFDLLVHRVLPYAPNGLADLGRSLAEAIRQTMARYELKPRAPAPRAERASRTLAVTGTMRADPARVSHRVQTLLEPYLDAGATWYCGSNGMVDEAALEYLVANGQRALAVGYNRYDFSETVRQLVEAGQIGFCDASVESVPKQLAGPSPRDVVFCAKAELVILFWDGRSAGTERLIRYFEVNAKNLLIGFV